MEKEGQLSRPGDQSTKGNDLWEKGNKTSEPCRSPSLLPERDSRPRCVGAGETQVDFLRWVNGVNSPGSPRQLESVRKSTSAKYLERLHWFKRRIFISYQKIKALIVKKKKQRETEYQREETASQRVNFEKNINQCMCVRQLPKELGVGGFQKDVSNWIHEKTSWFLGIGRAHRKGLASVLGNNWP